MKIKLSELFKYNGCDFILPGTCATEDTPPGTYCFVERQGGVLTMYRQGSISRISPENLDISVEVTDASVLRRIDNLIAAYSAMSLFLIQPGHMPNNSEEKHNLDSVIEELSHLRSVVVSGGTVDSIPGA